jgi:hypothetical protein
MGKEGENGEGRGEEDRRKEQQKQYLMKCHSLYTFACGRNNPGRRYAVAWWPITLGHHWSRHWHLQRHIRANHTRSEKIDGRCFTLPYSWPITLLGWTTKKHDERAINYIES